MSNSNFIPLAFGMGDGGELRQPLGVASVGGLLLRQLLTLYTTPGQVVHGAKAVIREGSAVSTKAGPFSFRGMTSPVDRTPRQGELASPLRFCL
jgi:hypothetical protein